MIEEAFGGRDPETAQYEMDVNEYADILAALKPAFIHHPESKGHLRAILVEHGADPELTYFDVPRLRTSTSDNYLTTGIAYAFHPHRDTWYSAPMMQLNWWLPIYDVAPDNVVAFHPGYFDRGIANGSERYNYYAWNRDSRYRRLSDRRRHPRPAQARGRDRARPADPTGAARRRRDGLLRGAAHSSVPNTSGRTRISVDFRVVHRADVEAGRGAVNVDSHCTGTTMRDYLRVSDLERLPPRSSHRTTPASPTSCSSTRSSRAEGRCVGCVFSLPGTVATSARCWCPCCGGRPRGRGADAGWYDGCDFGPQPGGYESRKGDIRDQQPSRPRRFRRSGEPGRDLQRSRRPPEPGGDVLGERPRCSTPGAGRPRGRVPRYVFSSSCSLYGAAGDGAVTEESEFNPVTPYGESKVMAEQLIGKFADDSFSPTYLRNATAYGSSPRLRADIVVNNLTGVALTRGEVRLQSDGSPWRPLVHAEDISRAFLAVLAADRDVVHDQAFNVGRDEDMVHPHDRRGGLGEDRRTGHFRRGRVARQARLPGRLREDRPSPAVLPTGLDGPGRHRPAGGRHTPIRPHRPDVRAPIRATGADQPSPGRRAPRRPAETDGRRVGDRGVISVQRQEPTGERSPSSRRRRHVQQR